MITVNGLQVGSMKFSGGEMNPHLPTGLKSGEMNVIAWCQSSDDIMEMLLVMNAIKNQFGSVPIRLLIPYLPYARQDRVCAIGEAIGTEVIANLLPDNAVIISVDIHNEAAPFLSAAIHHYTLTHIMERNNYSSVFPPGCVLVAPDKGATNKVKDLAKHISRRWIQGDKVRDPKTGALSGFSVDDGGNSIEGCHLVVVDDICDGGGTFIGLGEELNKLKPKSMDLYVTHGIFSKGYDKLLEIYTTIHTTDTFIRNHPKVINVLNILKDV